MSKNIIVLTGGGTAGHIMPNIALIEHLNDYDIHYIGSHNSMEEQLVLKHAPHVKFHAIPSTKFVRGKILKNLAIPFRLCRAKKAAREILQQLQPSVIFSKGGYVALPVCLAAKDVPIIMHESDFSMGLANKLALKKCALVCTSFSDLAFSIAKSVHTGAPLRGSIYKGDKKRVEQVTGLRGRTNLLITGGSLGAAAINEVIFNNIDCLVKRFNIVHITGKNNKRVISRPNYYQLPFTNNIEDYFAWADFCITRGGANALFELVALYIPSLVIPLPKGVSRGDQVLNANYFERAGCVKVLAQDKLEESCCVKEIFLNSVDALVKDKQQLITAMKSAKHIDGTGEIIKKIKGIIP